MSKPADKNGERIKFLSESVEELQIAILEGKFSLCSASIERIVREYQNELTALQNQSRDHQEHTYPPN